ncbi:MAG: hypothetical protein GY940_09215, partial [bacterium]|nr:hypothetical protein [bacterium]
VSLEVGAETSIPVQFTLPAVESVDYGICNVYYELYDADNKLIQLKTPTDSGRFAIYHVTQEYTPTDGVDMWLTVDREDVFPNEIPVFTLHVKNHTAEEKNLHLSYELDHRGINFLFDLTVPANETVERTIYLENAEPFFRLWVRDSQSLLAFKSLNRLAARTETTLTLNNPGYLDPGQPFSYTVKSSHVSDSPGAGSFQIRAILEKKNSDETGDDSYSVVDVIYDNLHDYSVDGDIDVTDTYQPALPLTQLPTGDYRVRLEVLEPRGYTETQRFQFFYKRSSGFSVRLNQVESGGEPI